MKRKIDMDAVIIMSDDYLKQIKEREGKNVPKKIKGRHFYQKYLEVNQMKMLSQRCVNRS